ncbi:MAG: ABC-F family ATP-binding cassette domain-containing protein, partial [Deltaproteobacteria bacterium]|nr:ABC-F family ATP-binding cassette domain-containing protein [Deltaproteobacteria bacterium]
MIVDRRPTRAPDRAAAGEHGSSTRSGPDLLLRLDDLEKRIGNRVLFTAASAVVRAGDRIGIVGPNGAGKTTLLHTLAGEEPCDAGRLHRARGIRIGMLRQEIDPRSSRSVREEARSALAELDAL